MLRDRKLRRSGRKRNRRTGGVGNGRYPSFLRANGVHSSNRLSVVPLGDVRGFAKRAPIMARLLQTENPSDREQEIVDIWISEQRSYARNMILHAQAMDRLYGPLADRPTKLPVRYV